jgi:hypothetical protein
MSDLNAFRKDFCKTFDELIETEKLIGPSIQKQGLKDLEWSQAEKDATRGLPVIVAIQGLDNKKQYNGKCGQLLGVSNHRVDKWVVYVENTDEAEGKILLLDKKNMSLERNDDVRAERTCAVCFKAASLKCKTCEDKFHRKVFYCSKACQSEDWPKHKQEHKVREDLLKLLLKDVIEQQTGAPLPTWNDQDGRNVLGATPLMVAITHNDLKMAKKILCGGQCDLLALDATGNSALTLAVTFKKPKFVEILLDHSPPEFFVTSGQFGKALGFAIRNDFPEIVELMLRKCPRHLVAQLIIPGGRDPCQGQGRRQRQSFESERKCRGMGGAGWGGLECMCLSMPRVSFLRSCSSVLFLPPLLCANEPNG